MNMFSGLKGEGLRNSIYYLEPSADAPLWSVVTSTYNHEHVEELIRLMNETQQLVDEHCRVQIMRSGPKQTLSHFLQQREFMVAMGKRVSVIPGDALLVDIELAVNLIKEEVNEELLAAVKQLVSGPMDGDHEQMLLTSILDGAVDAVYVIYQLCNTLGLPFDEAFAEVHRSNMAKKSPDGTVHYREDGKVLKPPGWTPPNLRAIIEKAQGEQE